MMPLSEGIISNKEGRSDLNSSPQNHTWVMWKIPFQQRALASDESEWIKDAPITTISCLGWPLLSSLFLPVSIPGGGERGRRSISKQDHTLLYNSRCWHRRVLVENSFKLCIHTQTHAHNTVLLIRKIYLEIKTVITVLESFYSLAYSKLS